MSEQARRWTPKVGDKVKVVGVSWTVEAHVTSPGEIPVGSGWYWVRDGQQCGQIHIRNLDPVLEDERTGKPRPPIQEGEEVDVVVRTMVVRRSGDLAIDLDATFPASDPRVRQIEHRNPGCKACLDRGCNKPGCTARGRGARKS